MPKRFSRKKKSASDPNVSAFNQVQRIAELTGETPKPKVVPLARKRPKNPAAVALGKRGGLKSAAARMEKIAPEERRRIASAAARARWARTKGDDG